MGHGEIDGLKLQGDIALCAMPGPLRKRGSA